MATLEQIARLRLLVAEEDETTYTEADLDDRIEAAQGSLDLAARDIWKEKAAKYTALANISEGGSSRSLDTLQEKALRMVTLFSAAVAAADTSASSGVRISRLTR